MKTTKGWGGKERKGRMRQPVTVIKRVGRLSNFYSLRSSGIRADSTTICIIYVFTCEGNPWILPEKFPVVLTECSKETVVLLGSSSNDLHCSLSPWETPESQGRLTEVED